jgi:hypothetical protein
MSSLINVNIPVVSAPDLTVGASAAAKGVLSSAVPKLSAPALDLPTVPAISSPSIPNIAVEVPNVTLPFSGTGLSGILAGSGPTFSSVVLPTLQAIVPAFAPGLTIGGGALGAALSAISTVKNDAAQLKTATENIQAPSIGVSMTPGVAGVTVTQTKTT